ncbi:hypothetical protein AU197_11645 [Mycobacterium sp. IS-1590]|nr:hypothetical protein AU197_11645 [Mycobacterium sp. IS-1590]
MQQVREIHDRRCQVCGLRLETPAGPHAVAVHIRPPSAPHGGPRSIDNMLCLCPNDAVRFVTGGIYIDNASVVVNALAGEPIGKLRLNPLHSINPDHLQYHRDRLAGKR